MPADVSSMTVATSRVAEIRSKLDALAAPSAAPSAGSAAAFQAVLGSVASGGSSSGYSGGGDMSGSGSGTFATASVQELLDGPSSGASPFASLLSPVSYSPAYSGPVSSPPELAASAAGATGVGASELVSAMGQNPAASRLLSWAASQVGTLERGSNRQPYAPMVGHTNGLAWCATFTVAASAMGGAALPPGANSASTVTQRGAFKAAGAWVDAPQGDPTSVARPGDLVYYRNRGTGAVVDHVGLVVGRTADGHLVTVEGNTSGPGGQGVHFKLRGAGDHIVGYGRPAYPASGAGVPSGWSVPRAATA